MKRLTISNNLGIVATIVRTNDTVYIEYAKETVAKDIDKWVKRGFSGYDLAQMTAYKVKPTDDNFLEEAAKHAAGYGFISKIEDC